MASTPKRYGLSSHLSYIPTNYKCVGGKCITIESGESGTTLAKCMAPGSGCTYVDGGYVCEAVGQCLNDPKHKGTQTLSACKANCPTDYVYVFYWIYCTSNWTNNNNICNYSVDIPWEYISTTQQGNGILAQNNGEGGREYILQQNPMTLHSTLPKNKLVIVTHYDIHG